MTSVVSEEVRAAIGASVAQAGGRVAFLFGSQVNGRTWAESDSDITVRWPASFGTEARLRGQLAMIASLTKALGALGERADVVDLDRAASSVAFRAIREGVCVYAANDAERVRAIVDVARRYDDDAPRRALYQQAALDAVARMGSEESTRGRS